LPAFPRQFDGNSTLWFPFAHHTGFSIPIIDTGGYMQRNVR
jgi:hypothetical protein